ncbi:MAG: hypothetical protein HYV07_08945 [Deltaproteobacteria bacterium]|nr:hypothetical protein [Deltaproteobacteria bacterium]
MGTARWLLLTCSVACAAPPTLVEVPFLEGTRATVVATEGVAEDGSWRVLRVVAADAAGSSYPDQDLLIAQGWGSAEMRLTALLYGASMEELGMTAGRLLEARLAELGRPLPAADAMYVLMIDGAEPGAWAPSTAVSRELSGFRFLTQ